MSVVVNPDRIKAFGDSGARSFCLVTNKAYLDRFEIREASRYDNVRVVAYDGDKPFVELFGREIDDDAHLLTILPDCLLHSVPRETLGRRKLLIMACRSGRTTLEGIQHFIRIGEATDPNQQERTAETFFEKGRGAAQLELVNAAYDTRATLDHLRDHYEWHEQLGVLDWGDQQVFPAGEIACFIVPLYVDRLDLDVRLELNGRVLLRGPAVVQSGPPSFLLSDQQRIFEHFSTAREEGVFVTIERGVVQEVTAAAPCSERSAEMLRRLIDVDSRYAHVYEIGFSINPHGVAWEGNCAMNEICGGPRGKVHLGLGMLPHTQYHLDLFLEDTEVRTDKGEWVLGGPVSSQAGMTRIRSGACPCIAV